MKTFVLDTNVLFTNPKAIEHYPDSTVIIPMDVLQEVDAHKKDLGEIGVHARQTSRILDELSSKNSIIDGIQLDNGAILKVVSMNAEISEILLQHSLVDSPDNRIISIAKYHDAILVSNDIAVRIKARSISMEAEGYSAIDGLESVADVYDGLMVKEVTSDVIDSLYASGFLEVEDELLPNQYVLLQSVTKEGHSAIARCDGDHLYPVKQGRSVSGIRPENLEQVVALDMLMDNGLDLISLIGTAGVGKTLLALSASLELVLDKSEYDKIILMKAPVPMGQDIGFLPGLMADKMRPYFQSYLDNLEVIFNIRKESRNIEDIVESLVLMGRFELVPPTYMRGRSIANSIVILDEAQNISQHEMKTIATRLGENSKLIVMGDVMQIDSKLDAVDNGLTRIVEAFKDEACAAHVTLKKTERSTFADLASRKL